MICYEQLSFVIMKNEFMEKKEKKVTVLHLIQKSSSSMSLFITGDIFFSSDESDTDEVIT